MIPKVSRLSWDRRREFAGFFGLMNLSCGRREAQSGNASGKLGLVTMLRKVDIAN